MMTQRRGTFNDQPPGFADPNHPNETHVCKLHKALYGMKQSGRIWYFTLSNFLNSINLKRTNSDHAVFIRQDDKPVIMGIYVDDPIYTGPNLEDLLELEEQLNAKFPFKALGEANYYLGTTIERNWEAGTISLGQAHYIDAAVTLTGLENAKPVTAPLPLGLKIGPNYCPTDPNEIEEMKKVPYRELLGILMYIAGGTRPDAAHHTNMLAQAASNPGRIHWEAAKHLVRYLKGTRDYRLTYGTSSEGLVGYSDASHGNEDLGWKSMSGYCFLIGGGAISWSAKKQKVVALSTAESEYIHT